MIPAFDKHPVFSRILYTPLWFGSEMPIVSYEELLAWALSTQEDRADRFNSLDRDIQRKQECYIAQYEREGILQGPLYNELGWFCGFDQVFSELAAYYMNMPIRNPRISIRLANGSHASLADELRPHFDISGMHLSIRSYVVLDEHKRLNFREVKPQYRTFYRNRVSDGNPVPEHHLYADKHYANTLNHPHTSCFGTTQAPHAVDYTGISGRCVIKVIGEWDEQAIEQILTDSIERYSENVLWIDKVSTHVA